MSDMSSSEKPEGCWPNRSASTTVCVAMCGVSQDNTGNNKKIRRRHRRETRCALRKQRRTLGRLLRFPVGIHRVGRAAGLTPSYEVDGCHSGTATCNATLEVRDGAPATLVVESDRVRATRRVFSHRRRELVESRVAKVEA